LSTERYYVKMYPGSVADGLSSKVFCPRMRNAENIITIGQAETMNLLSM
jgi:hypothetical protein